MLKFRFILKQNIKRFVNTETLVSWGESLEEAKKELKKNKLDPDKYFGGPENYTVEISEFKTKPEAI